MSISQIRSLEETTLSITHIAAVATGAGFLVMFFLYFRTGPQRAGDRLASVTVLVTAALEYYAFFAAEYVPLASSATCLIMLAVANLLFWSARWAHGSNRPAGVFGQEIPNAVVRRGPYRLIRHPFYLSYFVSYLALAIVGDCWWQYLIAICLFVLYNRAAAQEERLLAGSPATGAAYIQYCRQSWRWFPMVW